MCMFVSMGVKCLYCSLQQNDMCILHIITVETIAAGLQMTPDGQRARTSPRTLSHTHTHAQTYWPVSLVTGGQVQLMPDFNFCSEIAEELNMVACQTHSLPLLVLFSQIAILILYKIPLSSFTLCLSLKAFCPAASEGGLHANKYSICKSFFYEPHSEKTEKSSLL